MKNYEFDVFVSYSRAQMWPTWVENTFRPLFLHWLETVLGREANVFFDFDIESGTQWPPHLAKSIAGSAVLVPLWSKNYFNSKWCTTEMGHMVARQTHIKSKILKNHPELIIPLVIHDGDDLPHEIQAIQHLNISKHTNVVTVVNGETHERLSSVLRDWMPQLVKRIELAPPCDPQWREIAHEQFVERYYESRPKQTDVPRF